MPVILFITVLFIQDTTATPFKITTWTAKQVGSCRSTRKQLLMNCAQDVDGGRWPYAHGTVFSNPGFFTVEGRSGLLYITDLKGDDDKEVQDIVKAALKNPGQQV